MKRLFQALLEEGGPTAVEYAVMLALIMLAMMGSVALVGQKASGLWFNNVASLMSSGVTSK